MTTTVKAAELTIGDEILEVEGVNLRRHPLLIVNIGRSRVRNPLSDISVATDRGHVWLDRFGDVVIRRHLNLRADVLAQQNDAARAAGLHLKYVR